MCKTNGNCEAYYQQASHCHEAAASSLEGSSSPSSGTRDVYIDQLVYINNKSKCSQPSSSQREKVGVVSFHRFQPTGNGSGDLGLHAQQRADQEHEPGQPTRAVGHSTPGCLAAAPEQKLKPAKVIGSFVNPRVNAPTKLFEIILQSREHGQAGDLGVRARLPVAQDRKPGLGATVAGCRALAALRICKTVRVRASPLT